MLTIEQMTPEQKIGRVICFRRVQYPEDLEFTLEMIRKEAVGCVQVGHGPEAAAKIKLLREAADYPLLVINDMERGYPASGLPPIPTISLAATGNPEYVRLFAAAIARDARADGWSGAWSPVIDIMHSEKEPLSASRKPGDTPEAVTDFGREFLKAFNSYHFQSACKHFPGGKGAIQIDGHMAKGYSPSTAEELVSTTILPYKRLYDEGLLRGVMVGHGRYPNIDPVYPASLSKKIISLLRDTGFDGVLFTDSFAMMSILQEFGEEEAMILALNAGNDILLPNYRTPSRKVYDALLAAYYAGRIDDARLDEAVRRVMEAERWCAEAPTDPIPVPENIAEVYENIARDCITAVCADGVSAAVDPEERRLFVVLTPMGHELGSPAMEINNNAYYDPERVMAAIRERFPNAEIITLAEYATSQNNDRVLTAATKHDKVVFVSYCDSTSYLGTDCLTRRAESVIIALELAGVLEAHIHFGNPLAMRFLPKTTRRIFGYHIPSSQIYALDVLAGKYPAKGKMPFPSLESYTDLADM